MELTLRLYAGDSYTDEHTCIGLSLEREAYTPYTQLSALFLSTAPDGYGAVSRIELLWGDVLLCCGTTDLVDCYWKDGARLVRVRSRSFTAALLQNEFPQGMYTNITFAQLMTDFCQMPHVTYENETRTNYIAVKEGTTAWDCVVAFGYKLTNHYPYIVDNCVMLSPPAAPVLHTVDAAQVTAYGETADSTRIISHYHMEEIDGTPNAYESVNAAAAASEIVRHKQITFDRQFAYFPMQALSFRNAYSCRQSRSKYLVYNGFGNEQIGDKVSFGAFMDNMTISRVLLTVGQQGVRTKLWAYQDEFYNTK